MNTDTTTLDTVPLCVAMLHFRDSFVAFCNTPNGKRAVDLDLVLEEIEAEAKALRVQIKPLT